MTRNPTLAMMSAITMNLQGFANALIYGLTESVMWEWRRLFCGLQEGQIGSPPYQALEGSDASELYDDFNGAGPGDKGASETTSNVPTSGEAGRRRRAGPFAAKPPPNPEISPHVGPTKPGPGRITQLPPPKLLLLNNNTSGLKGSQ